jgi:UDP-N-acetylglucosamine--dolichyl-phosphate N-acetylglucosaminephosphotransferase
MIPITGNTINSIDVLNGVASGFMVIASFSLSICLFIVQNYEIAIVSLPLGFVSLAFYKYHKVPSKIFPGDSGALTLGAMYGAIAIVGGVEIIAAIALLPAVINSFLFLSSVKRVVEHRQIKGKPVDHTEDFRLKATDDKKAPVTLVRLILAGGPMSEKQVGFAIFKLAIFSGVLAVITAFMMGVSL